MRTRTAEMLTVRMNALTVALTEIARMLSPQQSAQAANAIGKRLEQLFAGEDLSDRANAALAADLAPLMEALKLGPLHPPQQ